MRAGALVSPCHVMAGLVPAIHVFARSSTDLAERDARNKSGHDERSGRTGETARLTQSHTNFRIGTLARLSNQGCGLRGDFWPHREGNGLAKRRRAGPRLDGRRPALQLNPRPALSREPDYLRTANHVDAVCPEGPCEASDIVVRSIERARNPGRHYISRVRPVCHSDVRVEVRLPRLGRCSGGVVNCPGNTGIVRIGCLRHRS